jgi:hypothetical protein
MTEIAIIGPRAAGKTTYLAALAHLSQEKIFPGLEISILGDENSQTLINMAYNMIKLKDKVGETQVGNEPTYGFKIKIPAGKYGVKKVEEINFSFVDYAGEIFDNIARKPDKVQSYINQLLKVEAWMVMLTDFQPGKADHEYQMILAALWQKITSEEQKNRGRKKLRMAVVMSKCERGEIWPGRLDPDEDLFKVRLPTTYRCLTETENISSERLRFFACSSFGVIDFQDPRPNRESFDKDRPSEFSAVLRSDCSWKPYGLITPLYWLSTGKVLSEPSL